MENIFSASAGAKSVHELQIVTEMMGRIGQLPKL